jgi:hypothetical protein
MMSVMSRPAILLLFLLAAPFLNAVSAADAGVLSNRDPKVARLVTSDIAAFWAAWDPSASGELEHTLQQQYLDPGSPGLQAFNEMRIGGAAKLAKTIRARPGYYAALREPSLQIESYRDQILQSFLKLKSLYEPALFPDVYFLIGAMNSAGTLTERMLLIGVDMHGRSSTAPLDELGDWERAVIKRIDEVPYIVAHELIHFQQHHPEGDDTLLAHSIKEGAADFLAEQIAGKHVNTHLHVYGNPRERALWKQFKDEMHGSDYGNWLYQGANSKDRPADLGYYLGYRICAAYYAASTDKRKAIHAMLNIEDFDRFLAESGYMRDEANL